MVARLTPDQKVACSNHVRVKAFSICGAVIGFILCSRTQTLDNKTVSIHEY